MAHIDEDMQDMEDEDVELSDSIVIESSTNGGGVEIEVGDNEPGVVKPNFPQVSAKDLNVSPSPSAPPFGQTPP